MTDVDAIVIGFLCAVPFAILVAAVVLFFRHGPWLPKEARREVAAFGRLLKYSPDPIKVMRMTPRSGR